MTEKNKITQVILPQKIEKKGHSTLKITWQDGQVTELSAYAMRIKCPCAKCVNEWTGEPLLDIASVSKDIIPNRIFSVGRYAMGVQFSDNHESGIFSYDYLRSLEEAS